MPDYTVWRLDPDPCDYPGCTDDARFEVGIDGSPVSHRYACKQHVPWAGQDALQRHTERAERLMLADSQSRTGGEADGA